MKEITTGASMKPLCCLQRWHLSLHVKCRDRLRQATPGKCQTQTCAIFWPDHAQLPAQEVTSFSKYGKGQVQNVQCQVSVHKGGVHSLLPWNWKRLSQVVLNVLQQAYTWMETTGNCWCSIGMFTSCIVCLLIPLGQSFPFSIAWSYQFYSDFELLPDVGSVIHLWV